MVLHAGSVAASVGRVTRIFGEVASPYDDARPGYPDDVRRAILDYLGRPPADAVELGAGTGKATGLLLRLGAPLTAIEPDPRMAALQTFSPFRRHSPELRRRTLDGLGELLDGFGGSVVLDLRTTLVLARP